MSGTISLSDELADQIRDRHEQANRKGAATLDSIKEAISDRVGVAYLVESAKAKHRGNFREWWRENGLPIEWAARYLKLSKTAKRAAIADKDQLRLIGLLPSATDHHEGQASRAVNPLEWVKWAGKLSTTLTSDRVKQMDSVQRQVALRTLEPVMALYKALQGK